MFTNKVEDLWEVTENERWNIDHDDGDDDGQAGGVLRYEDACIEMIQQKYPAPVGGSRLKKLAWVREWGWVLRSDQRRAALRGNLIPRSPLVDELAVLRKELNDDRL